MSITFPNITFIILIGIFTVYSTFLTSKGGLTDNRYSSLNKKITQRGKIVLSILTIILFLLVFQEMNNQNINSNKDLQLQKERDLRDKLISDGIKSGVDSTTTRIFYNLSKSFAKQGFKIDSLKFNIEKIKDSIKPIINNYNQDDPVIIIDTSGVKLKYIKNDFANYSLRFDCLDAGASEITIITYLFTELPNGKYSLSKMNFFPDNFKFSKNSTWTTDFGSSIINPKLIYIYLKGNYKTIDDLKTYDIDNLYVFNPDKKRTSLLLNFTRKQILKLILAESNKVEK